MKYVLWAWGQLQREFEVLALGEICFVSMGGVERGFELLALREMCVGRMGTVKEGVRGVGIG